MNRVCVFVDGENFRRSIGDLFPKFHRGDYLPQQADWAGLFDWITLQCDGSPERIRTYWYVVGEIDFSPYGLNDLLKNPTKAQAVLSKQPKYKTELDGISDDQERNARILEFVTEMDQQRGRMQSRFDGWRNIQNGIAARHDAIEFRRAGAIRCYLLENGRLGPEKAVDVKLATDMIFLRDIYDAAVVVSGDQDFVPAVQLVKDFGKRVVNVAFEKSGGGLLPGGARRLNQATDRGLILKHSELAKWLKIPTEGGAMRV